MANETRERRSAEEDFARAGNRLLLASAASFGFWQLAELGRESVGGTPHAVLTAATLVGGLVWSLLLATLVVRRRKLLANPSMHAALHDERAREIRLKAYRAAFIATMSAAALVSVGEAEHVVGASAARIIIVIGAIALIVAIVAYDGE